MIDSRHSIAFLVFCILAATAGAQNPAPAPLPDFIIPPPPVQRGAPGKPDHQGRMTTPGIAYDDVTGHHLHWDCDKRTWIDEWDNNAEIGYDGYLGENGEIIPPPEHDPMTETQAKQSAANPSHAVDAKTGLDLSWDAEAKVWKNTKTGKEVRGRGWILKYCPEKVKTIEQMAAEDQRLEEYNASSKKFLEAFKHDAPIQIDLDFEHRNYFKWIDVPRLDPSVGTSSGNSSTNGFGGSVGIKLGSLPFYGKAGGYYAPGLDLDATLTNGQSVKNHVDDYGFGIGVRYPFYGTKRVTPWIEIGAWYERDKSHFWQYNNAKAPIFDENRSHSSWTGLYGAGATYWVSPRIGFDFGASYNGQFKSDNADENFKLSTGLVLQLGSH